MTAIAAPRATSPNSAIGEDIDRFAVSSSLGGMVHVRTPLPGLEARVTGACLHSLQIDAHSDGPPATRTRTRVTNYLLGTASLLYDATDWVFVAEYARFRGRGTTEVEPFALTIPLTDHSESGYLSASWHALPWLDCYAAYELAPAHRRDGASSRTAVAAFCVQPRRHWSLKAEVRQAIGTYGLSSARNPDGTRDVWQVFALKSTLDF